MGKPGPGVPRVTREIIIEVLRSLGLGPGDSLFAHNSLSRLGWVEGGAEAVCRAYIDAVSPGGTVIMPAFTFALRDKPDAVLDLANEPSCVGRIPEVFRTRFATHRSRHISHSVAAAGARAEYFTAGHCRDAFDEDSAFCRLVDAGGYVVLNGADYNACTFFHCIEYALPVPYMRMAEKPDAFLRLPSGKLFPFFVYDRIRAILAILNILAGEPIGVDDPEVVEPVALARLGHGQHQPMQRRHGEIVRFTVGQL
ncbi:MAG: AAC(3) family N-acetyltransferase, partial [Planctomycetia bacterium]|nr:AAC(3) family N-acetyltransferase [Planctomycetia bacterium]